MIRSALAVLAGLVVFVIALSAMQALVGAVVASSSSETTGSVIDSGGVVSVFWLVWEALSMVAGGYITARIASRQHVRHAVALGAFQALMTLWAMFAVRNPGSPLWFWLTGILLMMPAAWLGARLRVTSSKETRTLATQC